MYSQPLRLQGLVIVHEYAVIWGILSGSDIILGVKCSVGEVHVCGYTYWVGNRPIRNPYLSLYRKH